VATAELLAEGISESSKGYRVKELRSYVSHDRDLFARFYEKAAKVTKSEDPKLRALVNDALKPILKHARREAANEDDFRRKRKVIIFSYYSDTVDWIYEHLQERFDKDLSLKA
jgi:ERCC4-related helicase